MVVARSYRENGAGGVWVWFCILVARVRGRRNGWFSICQVESDKGCPSSSLLIG